MSRDNIADEIGFSGELLHLAFDVAVAVILYALLRPVDRNIALLAAFMRFACDIILAVASLSHFAARVAARSFPSIVTTEPLSHPLSASLHSRSRDNSQLKSCEAISAASSVILKPGFARARAYARHAMNKSAAWAADDCARCDRDAGVF